jgi:hypothetical protein
MLIYHIIAHISRIELAGDHRQVRCLAYLMQGDEPRIQTRFFYDEASLKARMPWAAGRRQVGPKNANAHSPLTCSLYSLC